LPGELMKDPAQARANLAIHRFATVLRNKHHVILALPARMRQALPRFCHTVLLRICQQAILGGLYSRIAQSSSSRTRRTSGLPPLESYSGRKARECSRLRCAENFLKEGRHHLPRPLVRQLVVSQPRHADTVCLWIGEAVYRAPIADDLPVRPSL